MKDKCLTAKLTAMATQKHGKLGPNGTKTYGRSRHCTLVDKWSIIDMHGVTGSIPVPPTI
jgi:hypothetical protein